MKQIKTYKRAKGRSLNKAQQNLKGTPVLYNPDTDKQAEQFDLASIRHAEEQFKHYDLYDKMTQGKPFNVFRECRDNFKYLNIK